MTRRDEATPLSVEGVTDGKQGLAAVAVFGGVWGLEAIAQEGGISPFLRSQLSPVDCRRLHRLPGPRFRRPSQSTGDNRLGAGDGRL